jgi:hypothetical protein
MTVSINNTNNKKSDDKKRLSGGQYITKHTEKK